MAEENGFLRDTLVISTRKGFWASSECEIFPQRMYTHRLLPLKGRLGSSRNPMNNFSAALSGFVYWLLYKPRLILIGSANRIAPWFANFKKWGWLPNVLLVASSQSYLTETQVRYYKCVIVYCTSEIAIHPSSLQPHYHFIPLPADGPIDEFRNSPSDGYVFSGGGAGRDFTNLIEAVRGTPIPLQIVTFSQKTLNFHGNLPENVKISFRIPIDHFINCMAHAVYVVIPLIPGPHPHGHTTVVQTLSLGKAIISTLSASIDDYVTHRKEGLLVPPLKVLEYRQAILEMYENKSFRRHCEKHASDRIPQLTYQAYANHLVELCHNLLYT
jgi:glycosyltransferase involved in cell wall biosynthesis